MRIASSLPLLFVSLLSACGGSVSEGTADAGCDGAHCGSPIGPPGEAGPIPEASVPEASVPDADATPPVAGAKPPARPTTGGGGTATTRWFAVKRLQLGVSDRVTGAPSAYAWQQYGWDLDGRATSAEDSKISLDSCKRPAGSPTKVLTDGALGRDNNFGQHFMAVMKSLKSDIEEAVNGQIAGGESTLLLRLDGVGGDDDPSVPGALYVAGARGAAPMWDGADVWPIDGTSVDSMKEPKAKFPKGYMAGGVWVSGEIGSTTTAFPLPGFLGMGAWVTLESAVLTFDVKTGANGTIGGGVAVSNLIAGFRPAFESFGICPGNATYDQLVMTLAQSADLVSGAPQLQDTARTCDAISIGLGFVAVPVQPATSIVTKPAPPSECP
ncbi:MAG: hypothetical protein HYV09_41245 [Deltaproteobacteria bacterium]|nr:hypothetical protein [Deltaproteobacteria bacterium]